MTLVVDLLAVLIALLLLTPISFGVTQGGHGILAADLGLMQVSITFLGVLAAIFMNTLSLLREWRAQRTR